MIFVYDGSLRGLLSAIFEAYRLRVEVTDLVSEAHYQQQLFTERLDVETNEAHATRVLTGLKKASGNDGITKWVRRAFLSEFPGVERLLYYYVRRQMDNRGIDVSRDSADDHIRQLQRLDQQMGREIHRLHAFVRFQETPDGLYIALIEPDFNCLPLSFDHFVARYPAMPWLIYDIKRHYGVLWDVETKKAEFLTLTDQENGRVRYLSEQVLAAGEKEYQQLWQTYFKAVDIPERKNLKLHLQHVPKRYWKYLTEKV